MDTTESLIAQAEMGEEARTFLQGNLGQCLIGMAKQELSAAQEALERVDPADLNKVRELQNRAWRARQFENWIAELVMSGEQALALYRQKLNE